MLHIVFSIASTDVQHRTATATVLHAGDGYDIVLRQCRARTATTWTIVTAGLRSTGVGARVVEPYRSAQHGQCWRCWRAAPAGPTSADDDAWVAVSTAIVVALCCRVAGQRSYE